MGQKEWQIEKKRISIPTEFLSITYTALLCVVERDSILDEDEMRPKKRRRLKQIPSR